MDKPDENYLVVKNQDLKYIGLEGVRSLDRIRRIIETRRNNSLQEPHNKGGESLKEALEKLDFNIEFVKESIRKSDDKEEKAGLRKLLTDYEALKTKLEESAK